MGMTKRIVLLGAPGVGKGTQAKQLEDRFGWVHISTGDMLREAIRSGTELGKKASQYVEKGELVPDDLIIAMIEKQFQNGKCASGFILDGFPRTEVQAKKLDELLSRQGAPLDAVVSIEVPEEEIIRRLSQRLTCKEGHVFPEDSEHKPGDPCPTCGAPLSRRKDDAPETVRRRLEVYKQQTQSLIAYYRAQKILKPVDGVGSYETIFNRILEVLGIASGSV